MSLFELTSLINALERVYQPYIDVDRSSFDETTKTYATIVWKTDRTWRGEAIFSAGSSSSSVGDSANNNTDVEQVLQSLEALCRFIKSKMNAKMVENTSEDLQYLQSNITQLQNKLKIPCSRGQGLFSSLSISREHPLVAELGNVIKADNDCKYKEPKNSQIVALEKNPFLKDTLATILTPIRMELAIACIGILYQPNANFSRAQDAQTLLYQLLHRYHAPIAEEHLPLKNDLMREITMEPGVMDSLSTPIQPYKEAYRAFMMLYEGVDDKGEKINVLPEKYLETNCTKSAQYYSHFKRLMEQSSKDSAPLNLHSKLQLSLRFP